MRLRPGTTVAAFSRQAQALARQFPGTQGPVFVADESTQAAAIERSIRPQAVALALFALVLAVTAVLVVGQVATRLLLAASSDNPTLAALGMTRAQLTAAGLAEVGTAAAAAAVIAVATAVAASPLMPIGPARAGRARPRCQRRRHGARAWARPRWWRCWWRGPRGRRGGMDRQPARRALPAAASAPSGVVAWLGRGRCPGDRRDRGPVCPGAGPGAHRRAGPQRAGRHGTVGTHRGGGVHLRREPAPPGRHPPRSTGRPGMSRSSSSSGASPPGRPSACCAPPRACPAGPSEATAIIGIDRGVVPAIGVTAGHGPLLAPVLLDGHPPRTSREIVLGTSSAAQDRAPRRAIT